MSDDRLAWLDGIRGILCVWIVLFHFTSRYSVLFDCSMPLTIEHGDVGVACFFIITGYLCRGSLDKLQSKGLKCWLLGKLKRLYIPYALACVFIFSFSLVCESRFSTDFISFVKSMLMLPYVSPLLDGAHWYVFALVRFYLFYSVFFFYKQHEKKYFYPVLILLCVVHGLLKKMGYGDVLSFVIPSIIEIRIITGLVFFDVLKTPNKFNITVFFVCIAFLMYTVHWLYIPVFISCFSLLVYKKIPVISKILGSSILLHLGTVSYIWYLVHQNVGYGIMNFVLRQWDIPIIYSSFIAVFFTLLFAFCLNYMLLVLTRIVK